MLRDQFDFEAFVNGYRPQPVLDLDSKLIVDLFAGGGGMSTAIEWALGRPPHIAVNHSDDALSMHAVNHPLTTHYIADVYEVCPHEATRGRPVGLLHLSPDCTHHSQAAAGQPRSKKLRSLAWVGYRWGAQVRPETITLENVKALLKWGPLRAKRDKATGRVVKVDGSVAAPGEHVRVQDQFLVPDKKRAGRTWRQFVRRLESLGYVVETQTGIAADYGARTTRERLFMVATRGGRPIVWPAPTHFKDPGPGQKRWPAAAEAIDFSLECPSIFDRELRGKKPLAVKSMRRVAKGTQRFVLETASPFIVPLTHQGSDRMNDIRLPLPTITCANRGELSYVRPVLAPMAAQSDKHTNYRRVTGRTGHRNGRRLAAAHLVKFRFDSAGLELSKPLPVITAGGNGKGRPAGAAHALGLSTLYLAQMNAGHNDERGTPGHDLRRPMSSITSKGSQQQLIKHSLQALEEPEDGLVATHLTHLRGNCDARPVHEPVRTISAGGQHHGLVKAHLAARSSAAARPKLSLADEERALRVARFLIEHESVDLAGRSPEELTREELLALVTVVVDGRQYVIVDIGLRMLQPRELYSAQGFPLHYEIEVGHDGRVFTKEKQVRMCGNSVSPHHGAAVIAANCAHLRVFSGEDERRLRAA
ncbi:DNA cytosine methyltransferase [Cupriavidus metallidurans]|uniref:DNA cytosine methyltransferase n=1 Tax=Cupriavidus metallidurans TaxID=119219 RepID=UPI00056711D6|nr:DNA cytosine methyltransferase [Cupriavidus metallidurans]